MATVHITEAEAQRNLPELLTRVRGGEELVIENGAAAPVFVRASRPVHTRRLSESLRIARERSSDVTLDPSFTSHLNEIIETHQEPLDVSWE